MLAILTYGCKEYVDWTFPPWSQKHTRFARLIKNCMESNLSLCDASATREPIVDVIVEIQVGGFPLISKHREELIIRGDFSTNFWVF